MKKICAFLMILVIMAISLAAAAEGDLLQQIQERGRLIIATEGNWSPWTYHDENDKLTGFDIEVGTLIAESLGVAPDFKEAAWDAILTGVDNRVFDIACNGVGYTEVALVVRKDNEDIHTFEDLAGKKTANSPNSTYAQRAKAVGAEVTYVDTLGETMALLTQGRVDATINAKDSVNDYLSEHPDANIKIVLTVPGEKVCYPMKKGGETDTLVAAVNEALAKAREDGTLATLSVKYFGQDLTNPE